MKKISQKLKPPSLNLGRLIVFLTIVTGLVMMANTFLASYQRQQAILLGKRLELNHTYAVKIAQTTDRFLADALQQLNVSAKQLGQQFNQHIQAEETERLFRQTNDFSTAVVVNASGQLQAAAPSQYLTVGETLNSKGVRLALNRRAPTISPVYIASNGLFAIALSQPIFDSNERYQGYVGGTLFLGQSNSLDSILGEHYYSDSSYVYAVDENRRLLYHPEQKRVGTVVGQNEVINQVLQGQTGAQRVTNSLGRDMLAGYAPVAATGWGIVAQGPTELLNQPLSDSMKKLLLDTSIPALLILLLAWWFSRLISRPLNELAMQARELHTPEAATYLGRIRSWYFEARQLKKALQQSQVSFHAQIDKLNESAQTDPMTGLLNRRGLAQALAMLTHSQHAFGIIAIDIDHFKQVNDTYGHAVGDEVIQYLANVMRRHSRHEDILCRNGGEEFLMLLPNTGPEQSRRTAERLRSYISDQNEVPGCQKMTISLGVTHWNPDTADHIDTALKRADKALYKAKSGGRNRVETR